MDGYNEAHQASLALAIDNPDSINFLYTTRPKMMNLVPLLAINAQKIRMFSLQNAWLRNSYFMFFLYRKTIGALASDNNIVYAERFRLVEHYFMFPDSWSVEERNLWNRNAYEKYTRLMNASAQVLGLKFAHFLQPSSNIDKPLSAEEKQIRNDVNPEIYRKIFIETSNSLRKQGIPSFSLTGLFSDRTEPIYVDGVHCRFDKNDNGNSIGYKIFSEAIAEQVAKTWRFKRRL